MYFELMCVLSVRVSVYERRTKGERKKTVWVLSVCVCAWKSVHGKHKKVMLRNGCREEERV